MSQVANRNSPQECQGILFFNQIGTSSLSWQVHILCIYAELYARGQNGVDHCTVSTSARSSVRTFFDPTRMTTEGLISRATSGLLTPMAPMEQRQQGSWDSVPLEKSPPGEDLVLYWKSLLCLQCGPKYLNSSFISIGVTTNWMKYWYGQVTFILKHKDDSIWCSSCSFSCQTILTRLVGKPTSWIGRNASTLGRISTRSMAWMTWEYALLQDGSKFGRQMFNSNAATVQNDHSDNFLVLHVMT